LHLVGILFPHINEDARSKSHQIQIEISQLLNFCIFFGNKGYVSCINTLNKIVGHLLSERA